MNMRTMSKRLAPLAAAALCWAAGAAWAQATPAGLWKTVDDATKKEKSLVRVSIDPGGVLTGRIDKLLDPDTPKDKVCDQCPDDRKGKPLQGLTVIREVKKSEGEERQWSGGTILDPANGKTYKVRLTLSEDGKSLKVRGYIGTPMLGRTQEWSRVE